VYNVNYCYSQRSVKVDDVAPDGYAIDRATVRQRKTGHPVRFELTEQTRALRRVEVERTA
jgi:hypothetical protein